MRSALLALAASVILLVAGPAHAADPDAEVRVEYEMAAQIGTKDAWDSFLAKHDSGYFATLARAQKQKLAEAQEARAKADDARRDAEAQAAQKAAELRKQLEEQSARETAEAKRKLSEQAKKDLDEARRQLADQARKELDDAKHQVEMAQQQAEAARLQVEEARRQATDEARVQLSKLATAGEAAKGLAPNPDQDAAATEPQIDPADIARLLQAHLKRVGCNSGAIDGNWDDNSRKALGLFNKNAKTSFDVQVASLDALDAVRGKTDRVCPLICAKGQHVDGGRCVQTGCGAGFFLNSSGACEKKPEPTAPPRATAHQEAPRRPAAGGGKCFTFNGKSYCE